MKKLILLLLPLCIAACSGSGPDPGGEIRTIMKHQEAAWNSGNIEGFMEPYWKSDSLVFIGKKGLTYGWANTLSNYKRSYPDKAAMGTLQFDIIRNDVTGDDHANTIGKWTLYRSADTLSGHFTLDWKVMDGKWKIIADHSS